LEIYEELLIIVVELLIAREVSLLVLLVVEVFIYGYTIIFVLFDYEILVKFYEVLTYDTILTLFVNIGVTLVIFAVVFVVG